jgi:hypothetical protein
MTTDETQSKINLLETMINPNHARRGLQLLPAAIQGLVVFNFVHC